MKDKIIQKQLLEEIARVGQDDDVEALTEEKIGEICKKYNFSEAEFIGLEAEIFSAGNVTSLSDNEETLENVAGGKLDIKKSTATLLAALNVTSPFASSAFATGTKEGSPEVDTVKTRTQTPTDINSKKHNNSSKERIAKMYENATKYVQEKFGLTREKAKSIVSSDYISQKYQSAIKYVQENFGLSRVQAESVVAAMGVTGSLATTLFIHKAYKTLTPKKPRTNTSETPVTHSEMQTLAYSIEEYKQQILKDCKIRNILGTEPMFVFKINDAERKQITSFGNSGMVDNDDSLYVIIRPSINNSQNIKIVQKIDENTPYYFVLSKEEAKKLFSVDEIKVGTNIDLDLANALASFINHNLKEKKEEEKKEEEKKEEEKKEEVKEEEKEKKEEGDGNDDNDNDASSSEEEGNSDNGRVVTDTLKIEPPSVVTMTEGEDESKALTDEKLLKIFKDGMKKKLDSYCKISINIGGKCHISVPELDKEIMKNSKHSVLSGNLADPHFILPETQEVKNLLKIESFKQNSKIDTENMKRIQKFLKDNLDKLNDKFERKAD